MPGDQTEQDSSNATRGLTPGPQPGKLPQDPTGQYLDFEIQILAGQPAGYQLVARSPAGEVREPLVFPFQPQQLDSLLKSLEIALLRSGGGRRQVLSPEENAVQEFGQVLFQSVFSGEVRSRFDLSLENARARGLGLRVKLDIQAPELARLPWEFLYDARRAEFVCLSRETPVVRYIQLNQPIEALSVEPPLHILGMVASPTNLDPLNVQREKERVEAAVSNLQSAGLVQLTWLPGATWRDLQKAMRGGPWHIFHFIGHGGFDPRADEGMIALEDEQRQAHLLYATEMGRLLADHRSLRMAILNACDGARGSANDVFSSTASILVRRGLPAVLAMQYAITDKAAIEFSRALYEALADGLPVDAAAAEARKAVSVAVNNTIEWGTPVLYMRAPEGVIFTLPAGRQPRAQRAAAGRPASDSAAAEPDTAFRKKQDQRYTDGLAAFWVENWDKAIAAFQAILDEDPENSEARGRLEEATRRKRWAILYQQAQAGCQAGDLAAAVAALDELLAETPTYKDAAALRQSLAHQLEINTLYDQARRLHAAGQWQAVINVFAQIQAGEPAFADPDGLKAGAEQALAEEKRQAGLADRYRRAVRAMDAGQWQQAVDLLHEVQAGQPDHPEVGPLLERAGRELAAQQAQAAQARAAQARTVIATPQPRPDEEVDKAPRRAAPTWALVAGGVTGIIFLLFLLLFLIWTISQPGGGKTGAEQATAAAKATEVIKATLAAGAVVIPQPTGTAQEITALPQPSLEPTQGPTQEPTQGPTQEPSQEPTNEPTLKPTGSTLTIEEARALACPDYTRAGTVYLSSPWMARRPALDGQMTDVDEWGFEDCLALPLHRQIDNQFYNEETQPSQWWFRNDDTWLYLLARIPESSWSKAKFQAMTIAYFSDGEPVKSRLSDCWLFYITLARVGDYHGYDGIWHDDTSLTNGSQDAEGKITNDGTYYWFEGRKRLDSDDGLDWAWKPGVKAGTSPSLLKIGLMASNNDRDTQFFERIINLLLSKEP